MATLSDIRPTTKLHVIDLVRAAGVNVDDWKNFKGGPARASTNPKYCYEWAFVEPKKVVVLNLWMNAMKEENGIVFQDYNGREWSGQRQGKGRVPTWKTRARKLDEAISTAYLEKLPIRVIVCDGKTRDRNDPNAKASRVTKRKLDSVAWAVTNYDANSGRSMLVRGAVPNQFVDQFIFQDMPGTPERHDSLTRRFKRDPNVRARVLIRAGGRCEFCKEKGFKTANGEIYLETHHVIPLFENGPDNIQNVVALCPNDHRRAHHASNNLDLRKELLARLAQMYPRN